MTDHSQQLRLVEAILFAAAEPVAVQVIAQRLPDGADVEALLNELKDLYANRGVHVSRRDGRWAIRTAPDLAPHLKLETEVTRKLSRAAIETLAIVAYHQPVTRAELEEIRGVQISSGTLDLLFESGWIKPGKRRQTPGRPLTWVTTQAFLDHFDLESIGDLPGMEELKAAGLLDARPAIQALGGELEDSVAGDAEEEEDAHPRGADDVGEDEIADEDDEAALETD